jgi:hypothetical protein
MIHRWDSRIEDLNLILKRLWEITKRIVRRRDCKGRKPKHSIARYVALDVLKEASRKTLRGAEVNISKLICNEE